MSSLNGRALHGDFEITAISSVVYPRLAERYAILSVGTSVGRGYGPVLVSGPQQGSGARGQGSGKSCCSTDPWPLTPDPALADLRGRRVGVGGIPTTGWLLLRRLCPEAVPVEMPFEHIACRRLRGELDAGVMIHEELLYYPQLGLRPVADLGAEWCREHGLPLPVGLNLIRRDLGTDVPCSGFAGLRRSLLYALPPPRRGPCLGQPLRPRRRGAMYGPLRGHVRQRGLAEPDRRRAPGSASALRRSGRPGAGRRRAPAGRRRRNAPDRLRRRLRRGSLHGSSRAFANAEA